jgi:hypothetical protein
MSLTKIDRHEIVRSSADPTLAGSKQFDLERLILSSQGAWLSAHGQWATALDLIEWRHIMTGGRDQYARVTKEGFLFPLGHRAVIVTITERKVQMGKDQVNEGKPVAALRQRKLIFVRQPTRKYNHRDVPFRTATVKTLVTPNLDPPENSDVSPGVADTGFWPQVSGADFLFHVVATDWEGREIEFRTPQMFIMKSLANDSAKAAQFVTEFNKLTETSARRARSMGGQKIAFAPAQKSGDTTLETAEIVFAATGAGTNPRFLPAMSVAKVDVPAARQISGNAAPSTISFTKAFLDGAGTTIGDYSEVFAYLVGDRTPVKFTSDKTGGVVAPDFDISGISRAFGPIGGKVENWAAGKFNPKDIFPENVTLLGGIKLADVISDAINVTPEVAGGNIPQLNTIRTTANINGGVRQVFLTRYRWEVGQSWLLNTGMFVPKADAKFFIQTELLTPLDGTAPDLSVHGELSNFAVKLLPDPKPALVQLNFKPSPSTPARTAKSISPSSSTNNSSSSGSSRS